MKPEETIPYIVPGFKVSATIYLEGTQKGVIIPKTALIFREGKYIVFVTKENNILEEREVTYNELKGDQIEILKGIEVGDVYIANPTLDLKSNDKIKGEKNDRD